MTASVTQHQPPSEVACMCHQVWKGARLSELRRDRVKGSGLRGKAKLAEYLSGGDNKGVSSACSRGKFTPSAAHSLTLNFV